LKTEAFTLSKICENEAALSDPQAQFAFKKYYLKYGDSWKTAPSTWRRIRMTSHGKRSACPGVRRNASTGGSHKCGRPAISKALAAVLLLA
jgi:hypothetical protein